MEIIIISIFAIGYLAITLEHNLKIDKLIPALAMMAFLWAIIALWHFKAFDHSEKMHILEETLLHHLGKNRRDFNFLNWSNDYC